MAFSKQVFVLATFGIIGAVGVVGCEKDNANQQNAGGTGGGSAKGGAGGTGGSSTSAGGTGAGGTSTSTGTGGTVVDTTPLPGVNLMPNEEGFMKTDKNELGIQGAWYSFGCAGAEIQPKEGAQYSNSGKMCFKGTAPMVTDKDGDGSPDYSTIWGAGIGFDLCAQSAEEAGDAGVGDADAGDAGVQPAKYPLSACPYNTDLVNKMIGVGVRFSGTVNATELRVQFNEGDSVANSYYRVTPAQVASGAGIKVEFKDPLVKTHYNTKLKPGGADPNNILAVQFQIPTGTSAAVDWDFCVEEITALTAP
jgi:hypothetical protein